MMWSLVNVCVVLPGFSVLPRTSHLSFPLDFLAVMLFGVSTYLLANSVLSPHCTRRHVCAVVAYALLLRP